MPSDLSRFTKRALKALALSEEEVRRLRHSELGTEHLLLGLVAEEVDATSQFLKAKGVSLAAARNEAAKLSQDNRCPSEAVLTLTPLASRVLERAVAEAEQLGICAVEPKHILLSLIRFDKSKAAIVLKNLEKPNR